MTKPILAFCMFAQFVSIQFVIVAALHGQEFDFDHEVVPILRQHCTRCHIGDEPKGGFSLNDATQFRESTQLLDEAPDFGKRMMQLIRSDDDAEQMPPKEHARLDKKQIETLIRWVDAKLPWTEGFRFQGNAYQPPVLPRDVTLPSSSSGRSNPVDRIIDQVVVANGGQILETVDDYTFIRRASLDLVGLLPSAESVRAFVDDQSADKRSALVDRLLADETGYCEHWLTFWNDWLRNDYAGTGFITGGRKQISRWLYDSLINNKPYDDFARELIAPKETSAQGFADGIKWRGTVSAGQSLEIQYAQSVAQAFLGINMKCASCHDSFIDNWKLKDAYGLAAIYAREPLKIHRCDKPTGEVARAAWLFPEVGDFNADAGRDQRMQQLADLMTDRKNGRFARTIVNRLWAQLMGRGIVHPLDAMHTRPWNEDLLDLLANELVRNRYDIKKLLRLIATSQAYASRSEVIADEQTSDSTHYVYAGPRTKRMTAEQFMDAIWSMTNNAPTRFDAPVVRGKFNEIDTSGIDLAANWIWGINPKAKGGEVKGEKAKGGKPKDGKQEFVLRINVKLPANVTSGTAVVTASKSFQLFIAGREQARGDDGKVVSVPVNLVLKKGANQIVIVASHDNAVRSDDLALQDSVPGVLFEAQLTLGNKETLTIKSDDSWQSMVGKPANAKEGRLGKLKNAWDKVQIVAQSQTVQAQVESTAKSQLAKAALANALPVRASLLKSDFFTRALGRPNRDQIVTSRPADLTTLEAIELANNEAFAKLLSGGASQLATKHNNAAEAIVDDLFMTALSRPPTKKEQQILIAEFNQQQPVTSVGCSLARAQKDDDLR